MSRVLDHALDRLQGTASGTQVGDGLLFSGNRQESVPRALFFDSRLTPLERNAWQLLRVLLNDSGVTSMPSYQQLRPFLSSLPCSGRASDETIARALTMLRLTRWLTLARHRRDSATGRIQGNLYVMHDEPLTPYEAIQLDPKYLELVSHSLTHASKAVRCVGTHTVKEITEDSLLSGRLLPSRLQIVAQRLASQGWIDGAPSSESEDGAEPEKNDLLRNPKKDSTVSTVQTVLIKEEVRTVPRATPALQLPERFARLRPEQQAGALAALQQVEVDLQQPVLDEWAARCQASNIRNPAGYLFGIVQKALRGEFRAWAGQSLSKRSASGASAAASKREPAVTPVHPEVARQNIESLRALIQAAVPEGKHSGLKPNE